MPVLSASEGAQRRPNAQKRRGVRALFCEPNGWKFGHKAPRGLSSGALGRKGAAMRVFWPGPGPSGGASSYSTNKQLRRGLSAGTECQPAPPPDPHADHTAR